MTEQVLQYAHNTHLKISKTADQHNRNINTSYHFVEGEVAGVAHLVRAWYAISQSVNLYIYLC